MYRRLIVGFAVSTGVLSPAVVLLTAALAFAVPPKNAGPRIVVSANTQGVLEPCGCVVDQAGGLARRASALKSGLSRSDSVLIDGGNTVARLAPNALVLGEALEIMKDLGYHAAAIGPAELGLAHDTLMKAVAGVGLPVICSNILVPSGKVPWQGKLRIAQGGLRVDLYCVISPDLAPASYVARDPVGSLRELGLDNKKRDGVSVVIGYLTREEQSRAIKDLPGIDILLSGTAGGIPSDEPRLSGKTWLVSLPGSGRLLKSLSVQRSEKQLHLVSQELAIPASVVPDPRIFARVREFNAKHRLGGVIGPPSLPAEAVARAQQAFAKAGAECGSCHENQARQWATTGHAHAWETLRAQNAHTRSDCVGCHTTPLTVAPLGSTISGIGCTTCHGDGLRHSAAPNLKGGITRRPDEKLCSSCHTREASPHFEFEKYLKAVSH